MSDRAILPDDSIHVILTRFNVRGLEVLFRPNDEWLRHRLSLFKEYCVPGFAKQTQSDFLWLVFFDNDTPDWFRSEVSACAKANGDIFEAIYIDEVFSGKVVANAVLERLSSNIVSLITTRVDNDDAVAIDFVESIQRSFSAQKFEFINLSDGAQLSNGRCYLRPYPSNPFVSLVERCGVGPISTVFIDQHNRLRDVGPMRDVRVGHPMWLQIVHGENLANEIVGVRIPLERIRPWFAVTVPENESWFELHIDQLRGVFRVFVRLLKKPRRVRELVTVALARRIPSTPRKQSE